ncbi:MAG: sensor histidine kinase [Planctomycetota bacterium]|jgi:two-component system phosphate regulon sensor histidine kinase PhoR
MVLKSARNLHGVATGIVALSLIAVNVTAWHYSGLGSGWSLTALVFGTLGALAVVLLGSEYLVLLRKITSMAACLKKDKGSHLKPTKRGIVNELGEAINEHFDGNTSYIAELEKQIQDSEVKIQILRRQKNNTEAIIYSIRDAVIVIDEFDKLLMANEAAEDIFDFELKNSQHKPIGNLISSGNSDSGEKEFVNLVRQSSKGKIRHTRREIDLLRNDEPRTYDCIVSCVHDQGEQVSGVVAVLHDITREKEIAQMKNDFVSHVSHELKTPLSSITAYSEMLMDGEAEDAKTRKEFYSVIQNQAKRLNRLIEDILNISRIESGLVKVEKEPVSVTILIEEQLQMIKSYAEEKGIEVIGQKPIIFDQVYVDKDMISQVIVNLLSNAVKYTPSKGSIKIATEVDEITSSVRVSVTDTGVGIPEDEIEHVFDRFYRVKANRKQAKGSGLGLNLVKQIVEKVHNGRVFVTSKPGAGSTFGFELPLAAKEMVKTA